MTRSKPEPTRRQRYVETDQSVPVWVMAVAVIAALIIAAIIAYSIFIEGAQRSRVATEYACSLSYERDTTQWQNCVDDR